MNTQDELINKDILLVEYQEAQQSAEHHDNLVWTVTAVIWGGILVLLGFVLGNIEKSNLKTIIILISILGILLTIFVWIFALQLSSIKRQKYKRCKYIEQVFGMRQHSQLEHKEKSQRYLYAVLVFSFIAIWIFILWTVWNK